MRIEQQPILGFIGRPGTQLVIPPYQREYSWRSDQCFELWLDVHRAARAGRQHFTGTVLYTAEQSDGKAVRRAGVIDGQQRVTTVTIMVAALCRYMQEHDLTVDGMTAADLAARYLVLGDAPADAGAAGACEPKLVLSRGDAQSLACLVRDVAAGAPADRAAHASDAPCDNVHANFAYLCGKMADDAFDAQAFWRGLTLLTVIDAEVDDARQAQLVFESLNSKGMALSPADLIRNLLFVRFGYDEQKRLYARYWEPIEDMFPVDDDMPDLSINAALHAWLEQNAPELKLQDKSEIYGAFKTYVREHPAMQLEDLLKSLNEFCAAFSKNLDSREAKRHIDWVAGKLTGLVSERKLFGD